VAASLAAGIDIGGTKCLGVVLDPSGTMVREDRLPTPRGADALVDALAELAGVLAPYDTLGIGAAGLVTRGGIWRAAPNVVGIADLPIGAPSGPRGQRRHLRHAGRVAPRGRRGRL
jgi:glucokinase